jgi:hypothetical protein
MRRMGYLGLAAGLVVSTAWLAGCNRPSLVRWNHPHAHSDSLGETADEHYHRVRRISDHDRRLLNEDLDLLFLTERESRLTRWHAK